MKSNVFTRKKLIQNECEFQEKNWFYLKLVMAWNEKKWKRKNWIFFLIKYLFGLRDTHSIYEEFNWIYYKNGIMYSWRRILLNFNILNHLWISVRTFNGISALIESLCTADFGCLESNRNLRAHSSTKNVKLLNVKYFNGLRFLT